MLQAQQKYVRSDLENRRIRIQEREMGFFASNLGASIARPRRLASYQQPTHLLPFRRTHA